MAKDSGRLLVLTLEYVSKSPSRRFCQQRFVFGTRLRTFLVTQPWHYARLVSKPLVLRWCKGMNKDCNDLQ